MRICLVASVSCCFFLLSLVPPSWAWVSPLGNNNRIRIPPQAAKAPTTVLTFGSNLEAITTGEESSTTAHHASRIEFGTEAFWNLCLRMGDASDDDNSISHEVLSVLKDYFSNDDDSDDDLNINVRDCTALGDGWTVLHHACMRGKNELVQWCLEEQHADPNVRTFTYESTPLKWAASRGFTEIVKMLIQAGADQDIQDSGYYTPLHYSCLCGFPAVAGVLLGISCNESANTSITQLTQTGSHQPEYDSMEDITTLLKAFPDEDDVNSVDEAGFRPLHIACTIGRIDLVIGLLDLGAMVDEPNGEGRTPLFFAVGSGNTDVIACLLEYGAYVGAATHLDKTRFHVMATPGWTPLHEACEKNQAACASLLLSRGADINACIVGRETPLNIAAHHGHDEVAIALLSFGNDDDDDAEDDVKNMINVDMGDDWNTTPLHAACKENHGTLVRLLLEYGANTNAPNNYNETPLHLACWQGRYDIVQMLVERGAASIDEENKDNQTPVDYARQRGHVKLAADLITLSAGFQ